MKRYLSLLVVLFAMGCGQSKSPTSDKTGGEPEMPAGKPSSDETIASVRDFFAECGLSNVQIEKVSEPVEAPRNAIQGAGDVWVCSVTMTSNDVFGNKQLNKNWLVLIGRDNGKPTVKQYYNNLEGVETSAIGKEWFVKKGFPTPEIE